MGKIDKRYIIVGVGVLLIIVMVILLLVTGGKKNNQTTSSNKLVIWDSTNTEEDFSQALKDYIAKNPSVELEFVKKNPTTYETDSINAIASGKGPDVWIIPNNWMAKQLSKLSSVPENTFSSKKNNASVFKDNFVPAAYTDCVFDNKVYGLPLSMDTLMLYYNQEKLNKDTETYSQNHQKENLTSIRTFLQSPPTTWTDLATQVKDLGANTIALGTANIENASNILVALMLQYGAQMTGEDKDSALFHTSNNVLGGSAYPGTQALSFYTSFAKKGDPNFTWDGSLGSAYEAFVAGKVSMMIGYGGIFNQVTSDFGRQPNVAALPQIAKTDNKIDLANYQIMTVPKASQQSTLAWNFINYVIDDTSFIGPFLREKHLASPYKSQNQGSGEFVQSQALKSQSWYNPDPAKVDAIFKNAISQVLTGQSSQTVIEGAAAQVTTLLGVLKGTQ